MTFWEYMSNGWYVLPVVAVVAYLLGSINFAILVTNWFAHDDIRNYGSGNAGATNVLRAQGPLPAIFTTAGDLAKSVAAVLFARWFATAVTASIAPQGCTDIDPVIVASYAAGLFCIVGHLYPVFFQFRGGKGVLTVLGMFLVLDWRVALSCLGVFFVVVALFRMVSLGSILAIGCGPLMVYLYVHLLDAQDMLTTVFCMVMGAIVFLLVTVKHKDNIVRIVNGTENKLRFHTKKEG